MPLDPVPTYPGQYDSNEANNFPDGSETRREGDDHIRRMKASEKQTWTNVTGAVTASHTEINTLTGISTSDPITTFPSGTKMVFYQLSAPTSWTLDAAVDEHAIRLVGATGGGTASGTHDFSVLFTTLAEGATPGVGNHTLLEAEVPAIDFTHKHEFEYKNLAGNSDLSPTNRFGIRDSASNTYGQTSGVTLGNNTMIDNTTLTFGGGGAHGHSVDLDVKRANCIVATRD